MGLYMYGEKELADELKVCLDDVQGNFTRETLVKALESLKKYKPVYDE